jgi:hypothetical protein
MFDWITDFLDWLLELVKEAFESVLQLLKDVAVWIFDGILSAFAVVIETIPAPDFLHQVSISSLLSGLPPYAAFVISQTQLGTALAVIGAAFGFRLARKIATLFQW